MSELSRLVRAARALARSTSRDADIAHRYDHCESVARLCRRIGREEGADMELLMSAAYLHDSVPRGKSGAVPHQLASAKRAERYLRSGGTSIKRAKAVRAIIEESSYESFLEGARPSSIEAMVLRDADFLEAMGARGIARAFAFIGWYKGESLGELTWDPRRPPRLKMRKSGPDPSAIWHFSSKLLRLKDLMCTSTGRKMARSRHSHMVKFLQTYALEMKAIL